MLQQPVGNIIMCQGNCEPVYFKLGMMLNTSKLYSLISFWMTLMFAQGHRDKLELVHSFCCKVAWSNSNVCDGWSCKEEDCEEVL